MWHWVVMGNLLPNDKMLNWSEFKAFANDNLDSAQMMKLILYEVENMMGKGENAGQPALFVWVINTQGYMGKG